MELWTLAELRSETAHHWLNDITVDHADTHLTLVVEHKLIQLIVSGVSGIFIRRGRSHRKIPKYESENRTDGDASRIPCT